MPRFQRYRAVVVGKTGVGKSSFCNRMANNIFFRTGTSVSSVTINPQKVAVQFNNMQVCEFTDMPGLFDTYRSHGEMEQILGTCVALSLPGPHVFVYVISIATRFTQEDKQTLLKLSQIFGDDVFRYMLVVFTCKNNLYHSRQSERQYIADFVNSLCRSGQAIPRHIRYLIGALNEGRYAFIECYGSESASRPDVFGVYTKINQLITANRGGHYTNQMYQDAVSRMVWEGRKATLRTCGKYALVGLAGAAVVTGGYFAWPYVFGSAASAAPVAATGEVAAGAGAVTTGNVAAGTGVVAGEVAAGTGVVAGEVAVGTSVVAGEVATGTGIMAAGNVAAGTGIVAGEVTVGTGIVASGQLAFGQTIGSHFGTAAAGAGVAAALMRAQNGSQNRQ
ncbi:GTPase IMAP family member 7 [Patella vulgata]|uniref:GTPase IMAP family member 7 n=1 Tax=Patella vulgata TaxID=6465 RepID=UPI0024A9C3ED|nr:GTPase IMAP family member 7 [Patella vulgata]XP_050404641.2 GTPase IMAP family member 7 [Patella vulgata]